MGNYESHELTAVYLHAVVPQPPERRTEERRTTTLLRVGKLVVDSEERLCMLRNISSAGAMLKLYQPVEVGAEVEVEITPDWPVRGTVIWTQQDLCGVAFAGPVDVLAALRGGPRDERYRRVARTPRLQVRRPATLCTDNAECEGTLCDLSLNGAKVATEAAFAVNTEVAIFVDGLQPLIGRARWCRDGHVGVEFDIPLQMDVLAEWLGAGRQDEAAE